MSSLVLTTQQAREIDRLAVSEFGMHSLVLMENAGRGCADVVEHLGIRGPVVIACGKGNNGGDGFVLARHLELRGHAVRVLIWNEPDQFRGDAASNWQILRRAGTPVEQLSGTDDSPQLDHLLADADWVVDAILGTGTAGAPRPPFAQAIEQLNAAPARKLAVDLPSGLNADTGLPATPTFRADHTCTFVAPKRGFLAATALPWLGQIHVCDIGIPPRLLGLLG